MIKNPTPVNIGGVTPIFIPMTIIIIPIQTRMAKKTLIDFML